MDTSTPVTGEEVVPNIPNLKLAQLAFNLTQSTHNHSQQTREQLVAGIKQDGKSAFYSPSRNPLRLPPADQSRTATTEMAPYLESLTTGTNPVLPSDPTLLSQLQDKNKQELQRLETALEDAQTNLGETEVSDALKAKAAYLAKIGHKVSSLLRS